MWPVLVLPYLLTEIPQEEKSQEKGQPGRTTRGAPIAAQNAGDVERSVIWRGTVLPRRGRTIRETPRSRRRGGIADSVRSGPRRDQELFCRKFHNHRGTFRRAGVSDSPRYWLPFKFTKCGQIRLQNRIRHGGKRNEDVYHLRKGVTCSRQEECFSNIENFHSREEFILLRMVEDCILGSNFLRKHAAQLDFLTGELRILGQGTITIEKESTVKKVSALAIRSQEQVLSHLQELFSRCSEDEEQRLKFLSLLQEYQDIFASTSDQVGRCDLVRHPINTEGHQPFKQAPRRLPLHRRAEVAELITQMEKQGVIEESKSPWSSPIVLVKKKDGKTRFCVDYRRLNEITKKDSYPLPRIEDTLDALVGSSSFSTVDLQSGYWQIAMDENDKEKTAFSVGNGLWQFKVMPFGLCNAPVIFERLMENVLTKLIWKI